MKENNSKTLINQEISGDILMNLDIGKEKTCGLSSKTISRLKSQWKKKYEEWSRRNLSNKQYVYIWVDGIYCNVRMDQKHCILVVMGATEKGADFGGRTDCH